MNTKQHVYKLTFIAPTCWYYQVPIFRELAVHENIDLTVYFCSDEALEGRDVSRQYNSDARWGGEQELLNGYQNKTLKNYSPFPSYLRWPYGLINIGIWNELRKNKPDAVVLMSWTNPTWWIAILACAMFRIPFMFLTDTNVQREVENPWWKNWIKKIILGRFLFRFAIGFLCSGKTNERLYEHYGVPSHKLVDFAFSWELADYMAASDRLKGQREQLRVNFGIPEDAFVVMYCGRLSKEKGAIDLLAAYRQVSSPKKMLLVVGDGPERNALDSFISKYNVDSVFITGFQPREEVPKYYAVADLLVVPSIREATGAVVHEAMCFALPVIVSDQVGFGEEFVIPDENGYVYPVGKTEVLAKHIEQIIDMPTNRRQDMMDKSLLLISTVAKKSLSSNLAEYLNSIPPNPDRTSKYGPWVTDDIPPLLSLILEKEQWASLLDAGCGDGALLHALDGQRLLQGKSVFALEPSQARLGKAHQITKDLNCLLASACDVPIADKSIDIFISTQVIEHVPEDVAMAREMFRILSDHGTVYLSTVFKKPYGWYFYRNNGRWVLDPTHVREYTNDRVLLDILEEAGFEIVETRKTLDSRPLMDAIFRRLPFGRTLFGNRIFKLFNGIKVPIPGYYNWEIVCVKQSSNRIITE